MKHTKDQIELSESLLAACKAAGIEKLRYVAKDKSGTVRHFDNLPTISPNGDWWFLQDTQTEIYPPDSPPYADDWRDSLLEWVEPVKDFNITPAEAMTKWRESFAFTEAQKQAIEDHAVAENEPLADVLARHPESEDDACKIAYRAFMSEDHRTITGFPRAADIYEQAWQDALKWWDGSEQATGIEALVCEDIAKRQQVGIAKYGTTLADNPLTLLEGLQHAYEESLDFPIYLKKIITDLKMVGND